MNTKMSRLSWGTRAIAVVLIFFLILPGSTGAAGGGQEIQGETIVKYLHYVPYYGIVMDVAIDLFFLFGGSQKSSVEKAMDQIRYALTDLDKRIQGLDTTTKNLALELVRTRNEQRLARYRDYSRQIQALALQVRSKPTGLKERKVLVDQAAIFADALKDASEFPHFWEFSAIANNGAELTAEFSPLPGFILYNAALGVWVAALEVYSAGNSDLVLDYAQALDAHSAFLSTLPEKVSQGISCDLTGYRHSLGPGGQWTCSAYPKCYDSFSKSYLEFPDQTVIVQVEERNKLCAIGGLIDVDATANWGKQPIEAHYGVNSMTQWASLLQKYAKTGRLHDTFGGFEVSPYPYLPVFLYSIADDGSLQWRRHRPLPNQPADTNLYEQPNVKIVPKKDPMRAGTKVTLSQPDLSAEQVASGQRVTPHPIKSLPQTNMDGPVSVNNGWDQYVEIFPAGGSAIYALTTNGELVWYDHHALSDGGSSWSGPKVVHDGFGNYRKIIPAGDGILYAITQNDRLVWYKHNGVATGGGKETWIGPIDCGGKWAQYKHVFSEGKGVLFAIRQDGVLIRYYQPGWQTGQKYWEEPQQIGTGWQNFQTVFSAGNGSIYAVTQDGSILWYRFTTNPKYWYGPITVATNLSGIRSMFAMLPRASTEVR